MSYHVLYIMKKTTIQNKSQLAKLLATENIEVQENAVQTASFDVKDRILTIPIFKEEQKSKHVYDMLVGHEVSHALHTPSDGWMNMKDRTQEFRSFVNVIEDARIDKLIQKKYPGLTKDYLLGFKKMYKDNFFGTKGKSMSDYALIDKINMYFKSSKTLDFNFNKKENHFVKLVDACKSFADVQKLAEDILGYCKEELKKQPKLKKTYTPKKQEGDDKQEGDNQDSQSDNSSDSNDKKSADDKLNEFLDKQVPEEKSKDKTEDKKEDKQEGSAANGAGGDIKIVSITNQAYDEALKKQVDDNASTRSYALVPGVRLNKLIIPYKEYIKDFAREDAKLSSDEKSDLTKCKEKTKKFMDESSSVVNYLVKEFEMKKNAQLHARSTISKTGIIDPLKLHSYKYAEDIFKKMSSIPNQKNHGMIFLLDWSGSMQRNLMPTTEQLLNLVMFCRKINIPFSVYKFLNNGSQGFSYAERQANKLKSHPDSPFITDSKTLQPDQTTRLVQLFTHKQSKSDFRRCAENLHRSAMYFADYGYRRGYNDPDYHSVPSVMGKYYLSSTPLNESLIALDPMIAKFRKDYKTDKVALVTLTDGSANSINTIDGGELMIKLNNRYKKCEYSWRGEGKDLTYHLLQNLKKKYQLQTIGFFLVKKYTDLRYSFHVPYAKEALAKRMFTRDKFIADYGTGYDVYYYVKSDTKVSNKVYDDTATVKKSQLKRMFMSGMKKRLESRVLLRNFIKRVA